MKPLMFAVILVLSLIAGACGLSDRTSPVPPRNAPPQPSPQPTRTTSLSSPIRVKLSLSHLPVANSPATINLTVTSNYDASNATAQIKLPDGVVLLDGTIMMQADLKAGAPALLTAQIMFQLPGQYAIEGTANHRPDPSKPWGWGDMDVIYLTIGKNNSMLGWPPTGPVKVEPVPSGK